MNGVILFAILSAMPVAIDAQSLDTPSPIETKLQATDTKQDKPQRFVIAVSLWEEIELKAGKSKRRVLCEPTLAVNEGIKAKFYSGGTIPARVADRSNDLLIGTKFDAVVVAKDDESVRIACDVSVGVKLPSDGDDIRTYTQSMGIACDLKLGEKKTVNFDMGKRKMRLTLKVDTVDPIAKSE